MNWDDAAAKAGQIAQAWTREQGPGGAIMLFDTRDIRVEASGGLPDLMETLWLNGVPPSTALSRHRLMDAVQGLTALNFAPGRGFEAGGLTLATNRARAVRFSRG